jgi:hypothetical protein
VTAALLFALVQAPNRLWVRDFQAGVFFDLLTVVVPARFLGYRMRTTNTLRSCVLAHVLNNFLAMSLGP